jgi:hypothetical protein
MAGTRDSLLGSYSAGEFTPILAPLDSISDPQAELGAVLTFCPQEARRPVSRCPMVRQLGHRSYKLHPTSAIVL